MRSTTHFDVLIFIYITKWNSYLLIKKYPPPVLPYEKFYTAFSSSVFLSKKIQWLILTNLNHLKIKFLKYYADKLPI